MKNALEKIENRLPNGFHDSLLEKISIDYLHRTIHIVLQVDIGDPRATDERLKEGKRAGRLTFSEFSYCAIEPPDPAYPYQKAERQWITDVVSNKPDHISTALPESLMKSPLTWYFFINDWNAYIVIAAQSVDFDWL